MMEGTHIAKYVYVPIKPRTNIHKMDDIMFLYRAGWFDCFLQRLTPLPEEMTHDWECYAIYADGRARYMPREEYTTPTRRDSWKKYL